MPTSVTLLVPALNETEGMRKIIPQIQRERCDQILVVDGGSTDGTQDQARARGYELIVQRKAGIRHAYWEAFHLVRGEIVVFSVIAVEPLFSIRAAERKLKVCELPGSQG